jgi:hypothetical protein
MPPFTRRKVTSLERAQLLGIRTSRVSSWSRSRSFNLSLWAIIILLAFIIINALISYSKILYQIDSQREALRHANPSPSDAPPNETSALHYVEPTPSNANPNETSALRHVNPTPNNPTPDKILVADETLAKKICSSSRRNKWHDSLNHQFEENAEFKPSFAVVLTVNDGYWDFFLNWFHHFIVLMAKNILEQPVLIVIAEDSIIYDKLKSYLASETRNTIVLPGYDDAFNSVSMAENYDSVAYKKLVSSRATHLLNLICSLRGQGGGVNSDHGETGEEESTKDNIIIVYSDVDAVWVQNPFPYLRNELFGSEVANDNNTIDMNKQRQPKYDILAAVDDHNYHKVRDYYCTGFLAITPSYASISFLIDWEKELQSNHQLNQPIFNSLLRSSTYMIRHGGLGEIEFAPGRLYFDEWVKEGAVSERQKKNGTVVVHNNYIIGHDAKRGRFEQSGLWIT